MMDDIIKKKKKMYKLTDIFISGGNIIKSCSRNPTRPEGLLLNSTDTLIKPS